MEIIKDSMWKYKLSFDNDLYKIVKRYSFGLPPKEKSELSFEIDFFRTFFSIEQILSVFSLIKNNKKSIESFKKAVNKRLEFLLFCPVQLYSHYKGIINKKFNQHKEWLLSVLDHAKNKGITILPKLYYKNILGKHIYKHVLKICKKYAKRSIEYDKKVKIEIGKEKFFIKNYIDSLKKKFSIKGVWGEFSNKDFLISEDSSFGEGKWLDSRLTYSSNQFVLNNNCVLTEKECEEQFIRNVYPGHAHFYNSIFANKKLTRLDNGSSFLINGWNTFAFWHYNPSNHVRNHKYNNCKTISFLSGNKFNQNTINKLFNHLLTYNNKKIATEKLIQITQFPGLFESSIIGAIAVEYLIDSLGKGPKEFLSWLSNQHIGNYFEKYLYLIKKQK